MELEELALCTREKFEQELNRMCPCSVDGMNPGEFDAAFEERVRTRREVKWLRIEALLDGKLTVDQVVDQEHEDGTLLPVLYRRGYEAKAWESFQENGEASQQDLRSPHYANYRLVEV